MSNVVVTSIEIAAPAHVVWDVIMDPKRLDDWVTIHRGLGPHDDPLGPGARLEQTLALRGVPFTVRWAVDTWDPPHHAVWVGRGPARSRARIEDILEEVDGGTRFDYRNEFMPPLGPLGGLAGRVLVGGISEREANDSLRRLKALLESPS